MAGSINNADISADAQLARMGYKAELPRKLSMVSILGLCVSPILKKTTAFGCGMKLTTKCRCIVLDMQVVRYYGFVHENKVDSSSSTAMMKPPSRETVLIRVMLLL